MNFVEAVKRCYKKYLNWNGRASRSEFWYFNIFFYSPILFTGIVAAAMASIENLVVVISSLYAISIIWFIANWLPLLTVSVRRLHDVNMSGGWLFIRIIPFLGELYLLVKFCTKSDASDNRYGPLENSIRVIDEDITQRYTLPKQAQSVVALVGISGQYKGCKFPLNGVSRICIGTDSQKCDVVIDAKIHPTANKFMSFIVSDASPGDEVDIGSGLKFAFQ